MRCRTTVALLTLIAVAASAATAAAVRGFGQVAVRGAESMQYVVRTQYTVPARWHPIGRRSGQTLRRRFGPIGSCRIRVTISAAAVADAPGDAVARAARLLPGTGRGLLDFGTRTNAAYRVVRGPAQDEVNALLVKPAPTVRQQPAPNIVWIELRARALADPRTECHSGGPRTVGTQLGDAFAAARVGGFEPAR